MTDVNIKIIQEVETGKLMKSLSESDEWEVLYEIPQELSEQWEAVKASKDIGKLIDLFFYNAHFQDFLYRFIAYYDAELLCSRYAVLEIDEFDLRFIWLFEEDPKGYRKSAREFVTNYIGIDLDASEGKDELKEIEGHLTDWVAENIFYGRGWVINEITDSVLSSVVARARKMNFSEEIITQLINCSPQYLQKKFPKEAPEED